MIALVAIIAVCLGALVALCLTAPEGYEDKRGFHYGRRPTES